MNIVVKRKKAEKVEKNIMNLQEAVKYLNFKDENTFRKNCREGKIPCRYIGGEYRFSKSALDMWLSGVNLEEIYKKVADAQVEKALYLMS